MGCAVFLGRRGSSGPAVADHAMRESEERYRLLAAATGDALWDWDLRADRLSWSDAQAGAFGHERDDARHPVSAAWEAGIHPLDRERVVSGLGRALEGRDSVWMSEHRLRCADGSYAEVAERAFIVRDWQGRATRLIGSTRDITERRRDEARLQMLAAEVDHRARNMLQVVKSVMRSTVAADMTSFRATLEGRIIALGRVLSLLSETRWEGIELGRLVRDELAPYCEDGRCRTVVDGPSVLLVPVAAQVLALLFHELATNAVKYGALSPGSGRVTVAWTYERSRGLHLRWAESGGPPVTPPAQTGFGVRMIQGSVTHQIGGSVCFDWFRKGLVCELAIPARWIGASAGARPQTLQEAAAAHH
jgi:PAS domain S-box-containing protein